MQHADTLLTGGTVLTLNERLDCYAPGAVAVQGDSILAAGPEEIVCARYSADSVVDCRGQIVMPGLVNAHTHMPMSLLRAMADDLRLDVWLMGYMMPVEREFVGPEFVRLGTEL
ncbi:MAG: amidohydrolase, partial [Chloroflexota bacterium]